MQIDRRTSWTAVILTAALAAASACAPERTIPRNTSGPGTQRPDRNGNMDPDPMDPEDPKDPVDPEDPRFDPVDPEPMMQPDGPLTPQGSEPVPTSLRDIQIPEDFTFATSRAVDLTLTADNSRLVVGYGLIEIMRVGGDVMYRGPILAGRAVMLSLSVPTKDNHVDVKLDAAGRVEVVPVMIVDGVATHHFR